MQLLCLKKIINHYKTLYLLSIPGMKESIIEASKEPLEECVE